MSFQDAFAAVVGEEGDYSNDPRDSGGATRFGITEALARKHGYTGSMCELPFSRARDIYLDEFWTPLNLGAVDVVSPRVSLEVFDTAVNTGAHTAVTILQRCLNAFNNGQSFYADVVIDGILGGMTVLVLKKFIERRGAEGETTLLKAMNCLQGAYYIDLATRREKDEAFVYGWVRNRVEV